MLKPVTYSVQHILPRCKIIIKKIQNFFRYSLERKKFFNSCLTYNKIIFYYLKNNKF